MPDAESKSISLYVPKPQPAGRLIPKEERITYTWNQIDVSTDPTSYKIFNACKKKAKGYILQKKHILKNVCGVAYPGELLVILGSSGSGKTTLLNALTFHSPSNVTVSGSRCCNGVLVTSTSLTSQSAYVQQDDLFIGNLTVKEHLIFQALVRMDRDISYQKRMRRVEEVILELALAECQDSQIGIPGRIKGISGGEKKRLAFAAEVLTNPKLMFCDEPTSGLDSYMALNVVQVLKSMALAGRTVLCTIHQPSSDIFFMFDKILLMTEGRTAFLGSLEEADKFFQGLAPCPQNYNPADFYMQILAIVPEREEECRKAIDVIVEKYSKSEVSKKVALEASLVYNDSGSSLSDGCYRNPYKASCFSQFRAVMWRSWLSTIRDPQLCRVRFFQTIVLALVIGATYYGQELDMTGAMNINGAMFVILTTMTFQNVFAVLNVFCAEIEIFLREHRNGMYRTDVYFICKTIAEAPVFIITPIIFTAACYYFIALNPDWGRCLICCVIVMLSANVATSFGYLVSCACPNVSMALSVGPPLVIPFLLFGGYLSNISSLSFYLKWFAYLSWFRFGFEAMMVNQWENVTDIKCPDFNSYCMKSGDVVLRNFNFSVDNFDIDIVSLLILFGGYRAIAFVVLLLRTCKRR